MTSSATLVPNETDNDVPHEIQGIAYPIYDWVKIEPVFLSVLSINNLSKYV